MPVILSLDMTIVAGIDYGENARYQWPKKTSQSDPSTARSELAPGNLSLAVGVDPICDQCMHSQLTRSRTHFEHQRIGGHERVWPGIERAVAKRLNRIIELFCHLLHGQQAEWGRSGLFFYSR